MGKDAKEVEKRITTLYLIQKSSHDSVIKTSSMQYHSMNTDRVAIAACIMETNIAIMTCKTKNICQSGFDVRAVLGKGNFNIPSVKYGMDRYAHLSNVYHLKILLYLPGFAPVIILPLS